MKKDLISLYAERAVRFEAESVACTKRYNRLAIVRLVVFAGGVMLIVLMASLHAVLGFVGGSILVAGFYRLIRSHQEIHDRGEHLAVLAKINARELALQQDPFAIMQEDWPAINNGAAFADPLHPYSVDLDIFGPKSFFGYANRSSTYLGSKRLADMLLGPATKHDILIRQEAVAELAEKLDWRHDMETIGHGTEDTPEHLDLLREWLKDEAWASHFRWLTPMLILNPLLVLGGLAGWITAWIAWPLALLTVLPAYFILDRTKKRVDRTHLRTYRAEKTLARYGRLMYQLESGNWESPHMLSLAKVFHADKRPASQHLRQLSYLIGQLNLRYNMFAIILNIFSLWDLYWVRRLETWRTSHRSSLPLWFESLAEAEALGSFGALHFNNPSFVFPEVHAKAYFSGKELGHPLLKAEERVCNDLDMPTVAHIKLVTGSNMAGKSTFLRTIGLNIVLAMAGSSVCARELSLPQLRVFSSMRTQDALHESTSSFYAELIRLHQIIKAVEGRGSEEPQVFLLLDEILKGTNSVDRHAGSKALIEQFIRDKGTGLVATHDLELGAMAKNHEAAIENLCMEVEIENGELYFDYKLKPGVSKSFNATLLMKQMGIRIEKTRTS